MESSNTIDIISPLKRLEETAVKSLPLGDFRDGCLLGLQQAIELAGVMQWRIDMRLTQEEQLTTVAGHLRGLKH